MERTFIAKANEMGYFPDRKQAAAIWDQWSLYMAQVQIDKGKAACNSQEVYEESIRSSIEKVMGNNAARGK